MAPKPDYFAQYLPRLILQGHSAESAATYLRGQGLDFDQQVFDRTFGETQYQLDHREIQAVAPLNRKISPDEVGTATRPRARGYLIPIELAVLDPLTNEVSFHSWGVRSRALISPAKAIRLAIEDWIASGQGGRGTPEGTPVGGMYAGGAVEFVGPEDGE